VLGPGWTQIVALVSAFVVAVLASPAGVSGAVLLLPFQVSVLGTPSPAVTPTNLLYNVVATPGALYRYWRQGQTGGRLADLRHAAGGGGRVGDPSKAAARALGVRHRVGRRSAAAWGCGWLSAARRRPARGSAVG
jgi:hypothetical protein